MGSTIGNAVTPPFMKEYYQCPRQGRYCYGTVWVVPGFPHVACNACTGRFGE